MAVHEVGPEISKERASKELFLASLERCEQFPVFIPSFYARFLTTSPRVRYHFRNTDFDVQNRMLLRSLKLTVGALTGGHSAVRELHARAQSHSRHRLNIEPELHELWLQSLIATGKEIDPEWSPRVEQAWNRVLGDVVRYMVSHY